MHQVVTADGYILGIHRIPGKLLENFTPNKPPVLLQHGLEADMMQWVYNSGDVAPALVLARAGYDVWLGNNRGNRWSDTHVNMTKTDKKFWDWDWEEMGTLDTPQVISYILNITRATNLTYVGHSEGTT
jgi:pimeloyl-ACP methyl ester carboxylesterase